MALLQKFSSYVRLPLRFYNSSKRSMLDMYKSRFINILPSKTPTNEEWRNIREKVMQSQLVTIRNDADIMELCMGLDNSNTAISYFNFLKENNYKIDELIAGKYFQAMTDIKQPLTKDQQEEIKHVYEELQKQNTRINTSTISYVIQALCLTDDWMKACKLLENIDGPASINKVYNAIILAALRNNNINLMFKYFHKSYSAELNLVYSNNIHNEYIQLIEQQNAKEYKILVEKMFQFWQNLTIIPTYTIFEKYIQSCKKFGWVITKTDISNEGICKNCSRKLNKLNIDQNEYQVLKHVIVDNLFLFTSNGTQEMARELSSFRKFIRRVEYYNLVIDGLNMMYQSNGNRSNLGKLPSITNHFIEEGHSVLLIGRKHLVKSPAFHKIKDNISVFLVDNKTADDPFILYAALASGPETKFLSCDLMRIYRNQLPSAKLRRAFGLWQLSRQYICNNETWEAKHPIEFEPCACQENNHWHIACANHELGSHDYDYVLQWHCLQPPSNV